MEISVIISTYNGASKLPVILESLENQSKKDFELVIVVDGSTDETMDVLKDWQKRFANLRVIYRENGGRAAVRNTGAKNATGELLLFFDDDLVVDRKCVEQHLQYHDATDHKNIFLGEVIDAATETQDNRAFLLYKKHLAAKWNKGLYRADRKITDNSFYGDSYIAGANFSLTKKLYEFLGGLDESLNRVEDFEFGIRAKAQNIKIVLGYAYAAVIHRDGDNDFKKWVKKVRITEENFAIAYAKDPVKFRLLAPLRASVKNVFIKMVLRSFANHVSYNFMVSDSRLKNILPKALLYRVYDIIVISNGRFYPDKVAL